MNHSFHTNRLELALLNNILIRRSIVHWEQGMKWTCAVRERLETLPKKKNKKMNNSRNNENTENNGIVLREGERMVPNSAKKNWKLSAVRIWFLTGKGLLYIVKPYSYSKETTDIVYKKNTHTNWKEKQPVASFGNNWNKLVYNWMCLFSFSFLYFSDSLVFISLSLSPYS